MIGALRAGGVSAVLMAESERMRTACTGAGSESSGIGASSSGAFLIGRLMFGLRMLTFSGWHVFGLVPWTIQSPKMDHGPVHRWYSVSYPSVPSIGRLSVDVPTLFNNN
jgi:hypothetical protein